MARDPHRTFSIRIDIEESFTIDEIWPQNDAPENPTVDDVKKVFFACHDVHRRCDDWGLTIRKEDIVITDDEPMKQRHRELAARQTTERKDKEGDAG